MKKIALKNRFGKVVAYAKISDVDAPLVRKSSWCLSHGYAMARIRRKGVQMHRLILGLARGKHVDHRNGDKLDNRRRNLRICTPSQNLANSVSRSGTSSFKGVCLYRNKWHAQITKNYRRVHIGYFKSEREAAKAYNMVAKKMFGKFAKLNIL